MCYHFFGLRVLFIRPLKLHLHVGVLESLFLTTDVEYQPQHLPRQHSIESLDKQKIVHSFNIPNVIECTFSDRTRSLRGFNNTAIGEYQPTKACPAALPVKVKDIPLALCEEL